MPRRPARPTLRWPAALCAALLLAPVCGVPAAAAEPPDGTYAAIDAYVQRRMQETGTPGLSYAVVGPDGPLHRAAWGTDGDGAPVTPATPFLWGSVAKPVAATAVLALAEDGELGLDDPVVDHLPRFGFGGEHARETTVRHLLAQTSGLPPSATPAVSDCRGEDCPRPADRLGALDRIDPLAPPGEEYAYTSANYLVLAAVVESVTGTSFADHLRGAVLEPAGAGGSVTDPASARDRALPPGHLPLWGVTAPVATGLDPHGAAYGYLGGDLDDLAALASLYLREGGDVLSADSFALMSREQTTNGGAGTGYGLGWRVGGLDAPLDGAVWHSGAAPGYSAMLLLLPEDGLALVMQQNNHGLLHDAASMDVLFGASAMLAGAPEPGDAPSRAVYLLAVAVTTGLAVWLLAAVVAATAALRRPRAGAVAPPPAATAFRVVLGLLPVAAGAALLSVTGVDGALAWLPDIALSLAAAAAAGAASAVLWAWVAVRTRRGVPAGDPSRGRAATAARAPEGGVARPARQD
ncbi:serine hydrolase domain-containing protein [Nocardiopsis sp. NPDC058631]|uniref:serine hydrolase domain-containing protein n=1 Tax=Nocardiopsis sp. NPDC058631 TaxID=3346566 RepID=UPI00364E0C6B